VSNDTVEQPRLRRGTLAQAARELGISPSLARWRYNRGNAEILVVIARIEERHRRRQQEAAEAFAKAFSMATD